MLMNRHGFSLVELLAVIAIIGFIAGIGVVAYNLIINQSKTKVYEAYTDTMHSEIMLYLANNPSQLPKNGAKKDYKITEFPIDPIKNPKDENDLCLNSHVEVTRTNVGAVESFTYKVCLVCNDYNKCTTYTN